MLQKFEKAIFGDKHLLNCQTTKNKRNMFYVNKLYNINMEQYKNEKFISLIQFGFNKGISVLWLRPEDVR